MTRPTPTGRGRAKMGSTADLLRNVLGHWPRAYVALLKLKHRNHRYRRRIVDARTDAVIEGYPRSGTSFANQALKRSQKAEPRVASHAHHGAQVRRAAALGVPTLVVVRHPAQCIPSFFALREQEVARDPAALPLDVTDALRRYTRFHRDVLRVADDVLVVRFEDVIADFGHVTSRLNARYGCAFALFEHTSANVERIFGASGSHLSPSPGRQGDNDRGRELYDRAHARTRQRAEEAYTAVLAVARQQAGER